MPLTERELVADFTVTGMPQPKQRARKGKGGEFYTPHETVVAERELGWAFRAAARSHRGNPGHCYGVIVTIGVPGARHVDLDNCVKLVMDALNAVAWPDDNQVTRIGAHKLFLPSEQQGFTRVVIHRLPEVMPTSSACPECGKLKTRTAKLCRTCAGVARKAKKTADGV